MGSSTFTEPLPSVPVCPPMTVINENAFILNPIKFYLIIYIFFKLFLVFKIKFYSHLETSNIYFHFTLNSRTFQNHLFPGVNFQCGH